VQERLSVSERKACKVLGQYRSVQRHQAKPREDEALLTQAVIFLATKYGRYGYRCITALLKQDGWRVNHKRVERFWRREGLKVPQKQPKEQDCGLAMAPVSESGQSTGTMSGLMTLLWIVPITAKGSGC